MKELWNKIISHIPKKKKRKKQKKSKICIHKDERKQFKSKRNQLKISFGSYKNIDYILKYKNYILLSLIPITLFLFLFILFGPLFTVQKVNIIREDSVTDISLAYSAIEDIRGTQIIKLEESEIKERLINYQNNIQNIDINIDLPDTLNIDITSFPILFNTTIDNKEYYITQNGTVVPGINREELKNIEIKSEVNKNILPDYTQVYKQQHIEYIFEGYNFIEENIVDISLQKIIYYPLEREVHFLLQNDTLLIYTLSKDLKEQIKKTVIYNTEHNKLSNNNMVYVDFRATQKTGENKKDKIFYCPKTEEFQCLENLKKIY